jgi:hypothetical protein
MREAESKPMMTSDVKISGDTVALSKLADRFHNLEIAYKPCGDRLPYRWEVRSIEPPQYLGTIQLNAREICLPQAERRDVLWARLESIVKNTA